MNYKLTLEMYIFIWCKIWGNKQIYILHFGFWSRMFVMHGVVSRFVKKKTFTYVTKGKDKAAGIYDTLVKTDFKDNEKLFM